MRAIGLVVLAAAVTIALGFTCGYAIGQSHPTHPVKTVTITRHVTVSNPNEEQAALNNCFSTASNNDDNSATFGLCIEEVKKAYPK